MNRSLRSILTLLSVVGAVALVPASASAFEITSGIEPGASTNDTSVTLTWTDPIATTVNCDLDGTLLPSCTLTGVTLNDLTEGSHTLTVSGTSDTMMCMMWDPVDPGMCISWIPMSFPVTAATITFTVDRTPPVVTIGGGPAEGATITTASTNFTVGANEGTVTCKLDGAPLACAGSVALSGLAIGAHRLVVESTDAAGNIGTATRSFAVAAKAIPKIIKAPKTAKAKGKIKATVSCPDSCTIKVTIKFTGYKHSFSIKVAAGATSVAIKPRGSVVKKIKKALKAGLLVKMTLTPSGGGKSVSIKIK